MNTLNKVYSEMLNKFSSMEFGSYYQGFSFYDNVENDMDCEIGRMINNKVFTIKEEQDKIVLRLNKRIVGKFNNSQIKSIPTEISEIFKREGLILSLR